MDMNKEETSTAFSDHVLEAWAGETQLGPRWPVIRHALERVTESQGAYSALHMPVALLALKEVLSSGSFSTIRDWGLRRGRDIDGWGALRSSLELVCCGGARPAITRSGGVVPGPLTEGQGELYSKQVLEVLQDLTPEDGKALYQAALSGVWTLVGRRQMS